MIIAITGWKVLVVIFQILWFTLTYQDFNPIRTRALSPDRPLKVQTIWLPQDKNKVL